MEGPWSRAVDIITYGGISMDANKVKTQKVTTDANGKKTYEVVFTNGSKIKYPKQAAKNKSSILIQTPEETLEMDTDEVTINRVFGLEYKGTKAKEKIELKGSRNCTIDVKDQKKVKKYTHNGVVEYPTDDTVTVQNSKIGKTTFKSANNKVVMDNQDISFYGEREYAVGPGTQREYDNVDMLK